MGHHLISIFGEIQHMKWILKTEHKPLKVDDFQNITGNPISAKDMLWYSSSIEGALCTPSLIRND